MSTVCIIDDDTSLCRSLQIQMEQRQHQVYTAGTAADGLKLVQSQTFDLLLLDLTLPDDSGLTVLSAVQAQFPALPVVMITGKQDTDATMEAMRKGAVDYLRKPFDLDEVLLTLEKTARTRRGRLSPDARSVSPAEPSPEHEIVGANKAIVDLVKQIGLLSRTRVTVLVSGESGTGKELVARALHRAATPDKPFVAVNCSAVVPTLFESELFGHEKGAFTGAEQQRVGKLESADDGTLFLDEVADMPLDLQAKLLRVLQEHEFERVGGNTRLPLRARIVAATNSDLAKLVEQGDFREDLYYRLAVSPVHVPPLRERRDDIRLLTQHLVHRISRELHAQVKGIDEPALRLLESYDWPGNVRELQNVLTRAIALARDPVLRRPDVDFLETKGGPPHEIPGEVMPLREAEQHYVKKALEVNAWNITHTARALDISPTTLRKKIADYNLHKPGSEHA